MFTTPIGNQELLRNTNIFDSCVAEMVSSLPSTTMKTVPRRRNGRPQACEPCHKRKVACDHRLPVCSRCKRGGITEQCVYITKRTNNVLPTPPKSSELYSPTSDSPNSLIRPPYSDDGSRAHEGGFGYLGATSFSAVLQEAENSLSSMQGIPGHVDFPDSEVREKCGRLLDQKPSSFAVDILRSIPDHDTSIALFDSLHTPFDAWARLAGRRLLDSLWATFGDILDGPRSEKALWGMATTLCLNTADILKDDHVDPDRWFSEFSGPRFRWESIGILFAYWATALFSDRHRFARAGLYLTDETKITALKRYKNNAWNCSQLCWEACQGNSLMLFLLYQHSIIESNLSGDAEMKHWRLHGDVVAMTTYLGLHTSSKPENDASISTQIQRRLFASVFKVDKLLATFAGRPPLLSHRFCSTPLPLDLSDEELLQPSREAAASLNAQGWNTAGNIHHTTILRARTMIAYTRDAILEIALRSNFDGCEKNLTDLKAEELATHASFPPALVYSAEELHSGDVKKDIFFAKLQIQVEHLQNLFFIERLLAKKSKDVTQLVHISMEMVALALIPWSNQMLLESSPCDVEWTVMCYGGPAAGVLCLELLRPSVASQGPGGVSKSAMIQQLSKLIGILEWVTPETPNTELCANIREVLKKVLDRVLDPPQAVSSATQNDLAWMMDIPSDMNDLFNFELLDTFDWLRPGTIV